MISLIYAYRWAGARAPWAPLPALPGGRRGLAGNPSQDDLRRRLWAYRLRRLRETAGAARPHR